ncbi:TetR family regulatory protein [Salmonella enterica subsp. enterica]|nr:TetR family regulatory protein [Salmonella enterica subsp. enterica]
MTTDTTSCAKKSRGRPKVFDREAALDKAMTLFWQHGYEATSLADLVEATGAKAPTLYAEFTNKEGLFRAVLDRYITRFASKHEAQLFCEEKSVESALEDYFTEIAACFTSTDTPAGCFMINTSATLAASSRDIARTVKSRHAMQEQTLIQFCANDRSAVKFRRTVTRRRSRNISTVFYRECRSAPAREPPSNN